MAFGRDSRVRFRDWISEGSLSTEYGYGLKARPSLNTVLKNVRKGFEKGSDKIRTFKKPLSFGLHKNEQKRDSSTTPKNIINPQGSFLQNWNKIFLFASVIALAIDPLFFYIPIVDGERNCLNLHSNLEIAARGELVDDPKLIAIKYLSSYFIIDVLSILPLPQLVVLAVIRNVNKPVSLITKDYLITVIFTQYIPRILRIYPLYSEVTRTSGIVTETAWAGAAWNLSLYMLASHVFGALYTSCVAETLPAETGEVINRRRRSIPKRDRKTGTRSGVFVESGCHVIRVAFRFKRASQSASQQPSIAPS